MFSLSPVVCSGGHYLYMIITSVITSVITFVVTRITTPPHTPYTTNDTEKLSEKHSKNYTNSTQMRGKSLQNVGKRGKTWENVGKYEGVAVPHLSYISLSKKTHKSTIYNPISTSRKKGGEWPRLHPPIMNQNKPFNPLYKK